MRARLINTEQREQWNRFVAKGDAFSLMQGWEWGEFKEKLGWSAYRIAVEEGANIIAAAQVLVNPLPGKIGSVAYIPRGPLVDWKDEEAVRCLLEEIHRVARKAHAVFLKIEPPIRKSIEFDEQMRQLSFRLSSKTNQPRNTIIIDIQPEDEVLLQQMRQKTRQYIRRAEREGITIRIGNREDLPAYVELLRKTSQREHFAARSREYYEQEFDLLNRAGQCDLLLACLGDQILAARTISTFGNHAAEFHAGSAPGSDHLHPNYLLVWEAIKIAKTKGCTTYDLWGIPDEIEGNTVQDESSYLNRKDGLWGVYRFKSGFSRNVVSYAGAYDYVYSSLPYALIASPFISTEKFERIAVWVDSIRNTDTSKGE